MQTWLAASIYIDSRAENGLTALHLAAVNGSLECVRLLLDGGASMMVRTVDLDVVSDVAAPAGSTPLHVAAMTGHVAILQAMLQVGLAPCFVLLSHKACHAAGRTCTMLCVAVPQGRPCFRWDLHHALCCYLTRHAEGRPCTDAVQCCCVLLVCMWQP